jgi:hypothetical protein
MRSAPRRESAIERNAAKDARGRGWLEYKILRASKRGLPDRLFIKGEPGFFTRYVWVEFKRPRGEARKQQQIRHAELRAQGCEVYVVDSEADAARILD